MMVEPKKQRYSGSVRCGHCKNKAPMPVKFTHSTVKEYAVGIILASAFRSRGDFRSGRRTVVDLANVADVMAADAKGG